MELDHVVLTDVITPRPDGKIDLYGVGWDTIYAPVVPATHPRMDLAVRFLLSAQEVETPHQVVITLMGPTARCTIAGRYPTVHRGAAGCIPAGRRVGVGMIFNFAGVPFPQRGNYSLVVTGTAPRCATRFGCSSPPRLLPRSSRSWVNEALEACVPARQRARDRLAEIQEVGDGCDVRFTDRRGNPCYTREVSGRRIRVVVAAEDPEFVITVIDLDA